MKRLQTTRCGQGREKCNNTIQIICIIIRFLLEGRAQPDLFIIWVFRFFLRSNFLLFVAYILFWHVRYVWL